ncbi:MAG: PQQ-binding-like beta-propeller repeat protein [Candidatus Aenigmarchaeota archaeon]|nr:PQQ-binding-like beta-propeller repeat protein [Candidatus Aenigmarchaeota archaeon]
MEEHTGFGFDEFSVEMEDFKMRRTSKFDRIWRVSDGGSMCCIPLTHDGILYFGSNNFNIYAVDVKTGKLVWKFKTFGIVFESSPVYWKGMIFAGSFDRNMYALDAKSGELRWKYECMDKVNSMACIDNGRIYFASKDQNVYCCDARNGSLIWKFHTQDEIGSSPAVHDGKVYIGSFDKVFYCIDARNGRLVWKFVTQGEVYHANRPLIRDGIVYFTSFDNNLYALTADEGKNVWKLKTAEFGNAYSPVYHDGKMFLATRDGNLLAISMDGRIEWKFSRMHVPSIPAFKDGRIYVGFEDYNLYCLDMQGKVIWKFTTQGPIWLTAVFWGNMVIFPSWDCNMYAIDASSARVIWKFRTEGSPSYLPPAHDEFEVVIRKQAEGAGKKEGERKTYEFILDDESEDGRFYKSRITYQISTQYAEKGKYQIDSDEEAL